MKRNHAGLFIAFVLGAALGAAAARYWKTDAHSTQADLAGIEKLHQEDITATLASDASYPDQLAALWEDDGILLGQDETPIIGRQALREAYAKGQTRVLKYAPRIQNIQISGDTAYEWGQFEATFQDPGQAAPTEFHGRFLRVMRKQKDATWKFVRIMWQNDKA